MIPRQLTGYWGGCRLAATSGPARRQPAFGLPGLLRGSGNLPAALPVPGLMACGIAGDGKHPPGRNRFGHRTDAGQSTWVGRDRGGLVVGAARRVAGGFYIVSRPLGRLHYSHRYREPQWHHDDLALHPPDEV